MYLSDSNIVYVPDIKEEVMDYEKIVQSLDLENENIYEAVPLNGSRKRMRCNQLTWEEKIQRKKLRNRIAAQTSRDRKKAKMDYLEETVKDLKQQNELLYLEVEELRKKNEMLIDANTELQKALTSRSYTCSCLTNKSSERREMNTKSTNEIEGHNCVKDDHSFERPAESSEIPQQKGQWTTLAQLLTKTTSWSLWKIFLLYLLSQKCWQISRETHSLMTLKDWQQVCWKKLNSMKEEETQNLYSISGCGQQECAPNSEMVGSTPEILESSRIEVKSKPEKHHEHCFQSPDLTVEEKNCVIASEHSYACPNKLLSAMEQFQTLNTNSVNHSDNSIVVQIPEITITESEKISIIENELKKEVEKDNLSQFLDPLDIPSFSNFCSPRSEASSDHGYESLDSPYGSELSKNESLGEFWGDSLSELFPELM